MSKVKETLVLDVIFPLADRVMGTCAMKWYAKIKEMNLWSKKKVADWQLEQLKFFLQHAYDHTLYYHNLMDELGCKPQDFKSISDLSTLPIVTKEIIRERYDEFVPTNLHQYKYRKAKTGGTTGMPMHYLCDENTWGYVTAAKIYAWKTVGYHYGDDFVALGSASLFPFGKKSPVHNIYNKIRAEIPLNGINMTDEICKKYVSLIITKQIRFLYGYAASIFLLTKYVADHQINLSQIEAVFTTSEMLTPAYRKLIEETYQCRVMDCYGARDAGITAYEIYPQEYHVGYNVIAEVINPFDMNTGTLITTNFINYAFPLIRYQFGDEACLSPNGTERYNGQVITRILGRTSDVMRLDNGHNLTAPAFSIIMKAFDVKAFDITKKGGLEVLLRIQPDKGLYTKEQEAQIRATMHKYIGDDCKLFIVYVDQFEPLENGKRRYFINEKQ